MERPIGFWLKLVDRLIDESFEAVLDEHGVTHRQWQLLNVVAARPSTYDELEESVAPFLPGDEDETLAEYLGELVESDWLTIFDERYRLTERGTHALERLSTVVAGVRSRMVEGVEEADYSATVATLSLMASNLGWTDPDGPVAAGTDTDSDADA